MLIASLPVISLTQHQVRINKLNMKDTENKMECKGSSYAKLWLTGIFSFLIAASVTILIGALASSSESGIGLSIISLFINGIMLAAIIKQWRVTLNIGRLLFVIGMASAVIGLVLEGIALNAINVPTKAQNNSFIVHVLILYVALLFNGVLVLLLGRYTDAMKSDSYDEL